MPVRADAGVRVGRAGAPANGRGPAGVRCWPRRGQAAARGSRCGARHPGSSAGDPARGDRARAGPIRLGRELRDPAARANRARHRNRPGRTCSSERHRGPLGRSPGDQRKRRPRAGGDMTHRITRRQALTQSLTAAASTALLATGCSSTTSQRTAAASGSTLESTWVDPLGVGVLRPGAGERLVARTDLAAMKPVDELIATLAHVTDAHVLDASSPARATFLDRLGTPFQSTFRPHETLTAQVLAGALNAIRHLKPDAVIQGGDLIDNAQSNELAHALTTLEGGVVRPGSGPHGYFGVQLASDPDPFYYRPDLDAPRHPGLLQKAVNPFASRGLQTPLYPVLGDHDILVQGEITPTPETKKLALGHQALWELPPGLRLPKAAREQITTSPDGPPSAGLITSFLKQALKGPKQNVPADPTRREMDADEVVAKLRSGATGSLDYSIDAGPKLRLIVLDLARRK